VTDLAAVLIVVIDGVFFPRLHERPGLRPRVRILERGVVLQPLRSDWHEVLDEFDVALRDAVGHDRTAATLRRTLEEIDCLDDERVAFPVTDRVTLPVPDSAMRTALAPERS